MVGLFLTFPFGCWGKDSGGRGRGTIFFTFRFAFSFGFRFGCGWCCVVGFLFGCCWFCVLLLCVSAWWNRGIADEVTMASYGRAVTGTAVMARSANEEKKNRFAFSFA